MHIDRYFLCIVMILFLLMPTMLAPPVQAASISPAVLTQIPVPLHPWLDWVLRSVPEELRLPSLFQ